jgi:hypothetical protein
MKYLQFFLIVFLSACQSVNAQVEQDALLLHASLEVQKELTETAAKMLGLKSVLLSAESLTKSSYLPFDRVKLRDQNGLILQGLETEKPQVLKLVMKGNTCWLLHLNTNKRELLLSAQCKVNTLSPIK